MHLSLQPPVVRAHVHHNIITAVSYTHLREYYIKAIAANRLEKIGDAIMSIEQALELDPSLLEVAKVDGDIIDLRPEEQKDVYKRQQ